MPNIRIRDCSNSQLYIWQMCHICHKQDDMLYSRSVGAMHLVQNSYRGALYHTYCTVPHTVQYHWYPRINCYKLSHWLEGCYGYRTVCYCRLPIIAWNLWCADRNTGCWLQEFFASGFIQYGTGILQQDVRVVQLIHLSLQNTAFCIILHRTLAFSSLDARQWRVDTLSQLELLYSAQYYCTVYSSRSKGREGWLFQTASSAMTSSSPPAFAPQPRYSTVHNDPYQCGNHVMIILFAWSYCLRIVPCVIWTCIIITP